MSIEIRIYPPRSTRAELRKLLLQLGFERTNHLWPWPKGSLHFHWFEARDYVSFDGVEATIYPPRADECQSFGGGEWAVHTRTRAGASSLDRNRQNEIIRSIRQRFGGNFYNDWYGKNRYIKVDSDIRSPAARGIYLAYETTRTRLSAVRVLTPHPLLAPDSTSSATKAIGQLDPSRILYNALVPFLLAGIEYFFTRIFCVLLAYDTRARQRVVDAKRRVDFGDVLEVADGTKTIEDIVAGWYSFQNLDSIHKAFKECFNLEVRNAMRRRTRLGKRVVWLDTAVSQLITRRHGIVHQFEVDLKLDYQEFVQLVHTVEALVETVVDYMEAELRVTIRD